MSLHADVLHGKRKEMIAVMTFVLDKNSIVWQCDAYNGHFPLYAFYFRQKCLTRKPAHLHECASTHKHTHMYIKCVILAGLMPI